MAGMGASIPRPDPSRFLTSWHPDDGVVVATGGAGAGAIMELRGPGELEESGEAVDASVMPSWNSRAARYRKRRASRRVFTHVVCRRRMGALPTLPLAAWGLPLSVSLSALRHAMTRSMC